MAASKAINSVYGFGLINRGGDIVWRRRLRECYRSKDGQTFVTDVLCACAKYISRCLVLISAHIVNERHKVNARAFFKIDPELFRQWGSCLLTSKLSAKWNRSIWKLRGIFAQTLTNYPNDRLLFFCLNVKYTSRLKFPFHTFLPVLIIIAVNPLTSLFKACCYCFL